MEKDNRKIIFLKPIYKNKIWGVGDCMKNMGVRMM